MNKNLLRWMAVLPVAIGVVLAGGLLSFYVANFLIGGIRSVYSILLVLTIQSVVMAWAFVWFGAKLRLLSRNKRRSI